MSKKRIKWTDEAITLEKAFDAFVASQLAKGVKEKTAKSYRSHFKSLSKHIDMTMTFDALTKRHVEAMILSMRQSDLAHNSISSYVRVFKTFMNWSKSEGYTSVEVPVFKQVEVVKEGYSDEELERLLKRPSASGSFCDYRNWVIINFLLNSGCRASTIRNIQIQDVFLSSCQVVFRHTKNGKVQSIPLCSQMVLILRGYMNARKGKDNDFLFCDEYGGMLSENALRLAIKRYNNSRGVDKTSIHLFRHTFARKYLVDCGGNAFTLQKLLGHSTLKMTKHYCAIYDADIAKNYDRFSPLAQISKPKERISRR
jgi:integrase/recombinase XerD